MKKGILPTGLLFLPLFLPFALPQPPAPSYQTLLRRYADAERHYDNATGLSRAAEYGAREEALEKEWNQKALNGFTSLYRSLPVGTPAYDSLRYYTAFRIGELQHYFENLGEAVTHYGAAIAIKEKNPLPDSLLFKPLLYAGIIFYNQNRFDTAVSLFKRAEAVQTAHRGRLAEGERLYNLLGVLHYERGNYRQAQNYFQKALAVLPPSHPYYNELFANYRINLAQLHLRLEEYDKADEIYKSLLPRKVNLNEIHHNIGTLNLSLGAAKEALVWFRKVNYQGGKTVRLYNSTGQAFFNLERYDSARHYYQKATHAYLASGSNADAVGYGLVLKNLGDYHRHFRDDTAALRYYQQALHRFYPAFAETDVYKNPERFSGVFSYIQLFNALHAKAETWYGISLRNGGRRAAQEALKVYRSAFGLMAYVERTYDSDEARLFLTKTKHAVHGKPIDIAFALYRQTGDENYLSDLYFFDQQNKAAVLALNRQLNRASSRTDAPDFQKEQTLRAEITRLSIRAAQVTDSAQLAALHNDVRDREMELGKLQEALSPNAAIALDNLPALPDLQALLDPKTALVSYHLSPEKLTTLVVMKKEVSCHQQALPDDFVDTVLREIRLLKNPAAPGAAPQNPLLARWLLAHLDLANTKRLVIIPDDVLAYLPFESLRTEDGRFLIEKAAVQYQFSTALLNKNETDFSGAQTLAFAPFARQTYTRDLPVLPASAQEITAVSGLKFFDTAATKTRFLRHSGEFAIVHLATHAVADNRSNNLSYVVFSPSGAKPDNLLYAQEIYNLRLPKTGLVILSACETGTGHLVKGEGILSLSRAFAYAGCPNVITSLWKADDFSTAYLTVRIHRYLTEGRPIAEAVRLAKTDYLNDGTVNPRLKRPYYWSHLVFIGDYQPEQTARWPWFALAALPVLLLVVAYAKKPRIRRGDKLSAK